MNYLVGKNIKLVKFTDRYITSNYIGWLNNHVVTRYLNTGRTPVTQIDINIQSKDNVFLFAILSKLIPDDDGKLCMSDSYNNYIGTMSIHDIDWISRKGEVGYMIGDQSHWGIGIATEAVSLITGWAFNRINLNKVVAGVVDGNVGSSKALEKNGFKLFGTNPQDYYLEGKYLDTHRYYKLRDNG